jgi:hypothetical protein
MMVGQGREGKGNKVRIKESGDRSALCQFASSDCRSEAGDNVYLQIIWMKIID